MREWINLSKLPNKHKEALFFAGISDTIAL